MPQLSIKPLMKNSDNSQYYIFINYQRQLLLPTKFGIPKQFIEKNNYYIYHETILRTTIKHTSLFIVVPSSVLFAKLLIVTYLFIPSIFLHVLSHYCSCDHALALNKKNAYQTHQYLFCISTDFFIGALKIGGRT